MKEHLLYKCYVRFENGDQNFNVRIKVFGFGCADALKNLEKVINETFEEGFEHCTVLQMVLDEVMPVQLTDDKNYISWIDIVNEEEIRNWFEKIDYPNLIESEINIFSEDYHSLGVTMTTKNGNKEYIYTFFDSTPENDIIPPYEFKTRGTEENPVPKELITEILYAWNKLCF